MAKVGADKQFPPTIAVPIHRRRMRSVAKKLLRLPLCIEEQYFGTFENRLGIRTYIAAQEHETTPEGTARLRSNPQ